MGEIGCRDQYVTTVASWLDLGILMLWLAWSDCLSTCSFWHFHGFVFLAVEATETDTYSCSYSHPALSHQLTVSRSTVGEIELKENTEQRHPVCWEVQIPEPSSREATINIPFSPYYY